MRPERTTTLVYSVGRIRIWYALLVFIFAAFVVRSFYLQVIRHNYYQKAALSGQLKQYEIPAERGVIQVHSGSGTIPIVLNEKLYTLFADPKYVKDPKKTAVVIAGTLGGNSSDYEAKLKTPDTRYVVLAKKLSKSQKDKIDQATKDEVNNQKKGKSATNLWKGIVTQEAEYRTYPQGLIGSQLLGFVNDDGQGKYGIEQFLNNELKGTPGQLKAITDASGVPLAANKDNVVIQPKSGKSVLLTIDIGMQQQAEDILKSGLDNAHSGSGSAVILDVTTGEIKAMANYPTYNPAEFYKVEDANVFNNAVVSAPMEVGSIMKPLTVAAAIDQGVITKDSSYFDPGSFLLDGITVRNAEGHDGQGTKTIHEVLRDSLNTGATWVLMQMGGGEINEKARTAWNDYMVNHYQLSKKTGVEQGYEAEGYVPDPIKGYGLNITYANTAFGQATNITPLQMAAALASVINGGTYYKPHLLQKVTDSNGNETITKPQVVKANVVTAATSSSVQELMEYVVSNNYGVYHMTKPRPEYIIGGKTGTAQIAKPGGSYYDDRYNGTFIGFVGGNKPQYVIMVRVNEPHISGFAGAGAAAPVFGKLTDMLINNSYVTPKN